MPRPTNQPGTTHHEDARAARRRFLKASGAIALAVPVIESVTGKDLLTISARAQTSGFEGINGAFTGSVEPEPI